MNSKYLILIAFVFCGFNGQAQQLLFDDAKLLVEKLNINTIRSDFGPAIVLDDLMFSTLKPVASKSTNSEDALYDLFAIKLNEEGRIQEGADKELTFISEENQGPLTYCATTGELFLTQLNWENADVQNVVFKKQNIRLGIVAYQKIDDKWVFKELFPYNSSKYSMAHPTINLAGDTLIFASDMPGGFGMTDLYYSVRKNGEWKRPKNLGSTINSAGKEMTPFYNIDGTLIFSSNGHGGKGNFDLFYVRFPLLRNTELQTFAYNVNSEADDFGLIVHPNQKNCFFSSNRIGGVGSDDIYSLKIDDNFMLKTISSYQNKILSDVTIKIRDDNGRLLLSGLTNSLGELKVNLANGKYNLTARLEGFVDTRVILEINDKNDKQVFLDPLFEMNGQVVNAQGDVPISEALVIVSDGENSESFYVDNDGKFTYKLKPNKQYSIVARAHRFLESEIKINTQKIEPGMNDYLIRMNFLEVGARFELENIYYDLAKWDIRVDAAWELDKLVTAMEEYPDLNIRLESHTDSRGSDEYNLELSNKRSQSAFNYIVSKGIDKNRIVYKGYGESQLVNECDDGVECSEEEHAKNRRTIVEIMK